MLSSFRKVPVYMLLLLVAVKADAQTALDGYIQQSLKSNQGVHQQNFQLERSIYALKQARALYLPSVSLLGTYTVAGGGRTIDFPVGDMLNPVYSTLNKLTESNEFPTLKNESILLNPNNFYDAKFRTALPLVNAEIWYNKQIKQVQITQQQAALNVYKRELVKDIKTAYYQYYQADKAVNIYKNALALVNENIRVNESLLRNGVRNSTALTRAQAEKQKIEASLNSAENSRNNARSYFNFLLNRSLDEVIILDELSVKSIEQSAVTGVDQREELQQLRAAETIYGISRKMQQSYIVPKLNTFVDVGSQGFNFRFDNNSKYYLAGLNLQWDLFAAGQNSYKVKQAELDVKATHEKLDQTEKALQLQWSQVRNNYNTAMANYKSAEKQLQLAEKYYNDQLKVYKEGQLLYIELLDAQNQLTNSQLQSSVAFAQVLIAGAEMERTTAAYPLDK
jgi:outer membrane protein TolC